MLVEHYEGVSSVDLFAPVADLLPPPAARIADIGAGTGRDAAWLAASGYQVTAVEPAAAIRAAGRLLHAGSTINWIDDHLPNLDRLRQSGERYDVLLAIGVWHHLDAGQRREALTAMDALLADGGVILLRVRHGPTAPGRGGFDLPIADTVEAATVSGLRTVANRPVPALGAENRALGVTWTWLGLARS